MRIAQAVCISLARRADRREMFAKRWEASGLGDLTDVRIVDAVDGGELGWPAAAACLLSHRTELERVSGVTLMLEDDVVFSEHCALRLEELEPPSDWELLWVGGQHMSRPKPLRPDLVRPTGITRTHAYLVRHPEVVASRLQPRPDLDVQLGMMTLQQYALHPFEAGQDAGLSDIDGRWRELPTFWNTLPTRTMR